MSKENEPNDFDNEKEHSDEDKLSQFFTFAKTNTRDMLSYVLLVLGLVILLSSPWTGGLMIGLLWGLYFSREILGIFRGFSTSIENTPLVKNVIGWGVLLGFFLAVPSIFIGAAVALGIRQFTLEDKA